jgi:hypothetical protein
MPRFRKQGWMMTYDQFVRELEAAGFSGRELGRLLGFHKNSISNYSMRGLVPSHLAVIARLLAIAKAHGIPVRAELEGLAARK